MLAVAAEHRSKVMKTNMQQEFCMAIWVTMPCTADLQTGGQNPSRKDIVSSISREVTAQSKQHAYSTCIYLPGWNTIATLL